jgi:hypothetical protein
VMGMESMGSCKLYYVIFISYLFNQSTPLPFADFFLYFAQLIANTSGLF